MKTEISREDYLKFVGLFALGHHYTKALREIEVAAAEVIEALPQFDDYYGHISDAMCDVDESPDNVLRKLKITVKKGKKK